MDDLCTRAEKRGKPLLTVRKLAADGREVYRYPGRLLWVANGAMMLVARFRMGDITVGGLFMGVGDCFVETYYADRWYNILAVHARDDGRLRGWYVNIGAPQTLTAEVVAYRDFALDLVVFPNGAQNLLDADEFAALALSPQERERALFALAQARRRFSRCLGTKVAP